MHSWWFLLCALKPEKYRERSTIDVSWAHDFDYRGFPTEELRERLSQLRLEQDTSRSQARTTRSGRGKPSSASRNKAASFSGCVPPVTATASLGITIGSGCFCRSTR